MQEIELKFLDIDVEKTIKQLESFGAKQEFSHDIHDTFFEAEGYSPRGAKGYKVLRVRSVGEHVEITHKAPLPGKFKNVQETEIRSESSHKETVALIEKLGFTRAQEYHKHRKHFVAENAHFEIDSFDGLPSYLEIETNSEEMMEQVCKELGLDIKQGRVEPAMSIYPEHFGY